MRTTQNAKESVHAYYERLMQIHRQYSGMEDPDKEGVLGFVSAFYVGFGFRVGYAVATECDVLVSKVD